MSSLAEAERLRLEGNALFGESRYNDAWLKYTQAMSAVPAKGDVAHRRALATLHSNRSAASLKRPQGNTTEALQDAIRARKLRPTWGKAYMREALVLQKMGLNSDAVRTLAKALALKVDENSASEFPPKQRAVLKKMHAELSAKLPSLARASAWPPSPPAGPPPASSRSKPPPPPWMLRRNGAPPRPSPAQQHWAQRRGEGPGGGSFYRPRASTSTSTSTRGGSGGAGAARGHNGVPPPPPSAQQQHWARRRGDGPGDSSDSDRPPPRRPRASERGAMLARGGGGRRRRVGGGGGGEGGRFSVPTCECCAPGGSGPRCGLPTASGNARGYNARGSGTSRSADDDSRRKRVLAARRTAGFTTPSSLVPRVRAAVQRCKDAAVSARQLAAEGRFIVDKIPAATVGEKEQGGPGAGAAKTTSPSYDKTILRMAKENNVPGLLRRIATGSAPGGANAYGQTGLHVAALCNCVEAAATLIYAGANIDARNYIKGSTPLHCAAMRGQKDVCQLLLHLGASAAAEDDAGQCPWECVGASDDVALRVMLGGPSSELADAARAGDQNKVMEIISKAADGAGNTSRSIHELMCVPDQSGDTCILAAAKAGQWQIMIWLVEYASSLGPGLPDADADANSDDDTSSSSGRKTSSSKLAARSTLSSASASQSAEALCIVLNCTDANGNSPLHIAVAAKIVEEEDEDDSSSDEEDEDPKEEERKKPASLPLLACGTLLGAGADVNARTRKRSEDDGDRSKSISVVDRVSIGAGHATALMLAAANGSASAVKLLLEHRTSATSTTSTDLLDLELDARDESGGTALFYALEDDHDDVAALLLRAGADASFGANKKDGTLLAWAVARQNVDHVALLLRQGGGTSTGGAATVSAGLGGGEKTEAATRKGKASRTMDLEILGRAGRSGMLPLHLGARGGNVKIVRLLLEHGAAVFLDAKDSQGNTALDLARSNSGSRRNPQRWLDVATLLQETSSQAETETTAFSSGSGDSAMLQEYLPFVRALDSGVPRAVVQKKMTLRGLESSRLDDAIRVLSAEAARMDAAAAAADVTKEKEKGGEQTGNNSNRSNEDRAEEAEADAAEAEVMMEKRAEKKEAAEKKEKNEDELSATATTAAAAAAAAEEEEHQQ